jgi:hypothetical protein
LGVGWRTAAAVGTTVAFGCHCRDCADRACPQLLVKTAAVERSSLRPTLHSRFPMDRLLSVVSIANGWAEALPAKGPQP